MQRMSCLTLACLVTLPCLSSTLSAQDTLFLSVPPETLVVQEPSTGKFIKAVKRGKGLYPNWANLRDETIAQGGFAPGTSQSDSAGGLRVGLSFMERRNPGTPAKPNWKPIKDSAKVHGWVRIGKWNFKKSVGAAPIAIPQTLHSKPGLYHTGPARGLDSTRNPGDSNRKAFVKEHKKLEPKKTSNKLFAEMVALKLNIVTSALGKTPPGLGDLIFDRTGNLCDELSVFEIAARADSMMTYWQVHTPEEFDSLWSAVRSINIAFVGPLDTLTWQTPEPSYPKGTLRVKGQVNINSVDYLRLPSPFVPTRIEPASYVLEPDEDFEDDEFVEGEEGPVVAKVYPNFPNPFNPSTTISFRLRSPSLVSITLFNILGQEIGVLIGGEEFDEGYQHVEFVADKLASGTYVYRIHVQELESRAEFVTTGKMLLVK